MHVVHIRTPAHRCRQLRLWLRRPILSSFGNIRDRGRCRCRKASSDNGLILGGSELLWDGGGRRLRWCRGGLPIRVCGWGSDCSCLCGYFSTDSLHVWGLDEGRVICAWGWVELLAWRVWGGEGWLLGWWWLIGIWREARKLVWLIAIRRGVHHPIWYMLMAIRMGVKRLI